VEDSEQFTAELDMLQKRRTRSFCYIRDISAISLSLRVKHKTHFQKKGRSTWKRLNCRERSSPRLQLYLTFWQVFRCQPMLLQLAVNIPPTLSCKCRTNATQKPLTLLEASCIIYPWHFIFILKYVRYGCNLHRFASYMGIFSVGE
jgi:hypothetical protein